jgi:hypothetical protein
MRPDPPALLITGYADFAPLSADTLAQDQFVRKPFRSVDLLDRIAMVGTPTRGRPSGCRTIQAGHPASPLDVSRR